MPYKFKGKRDCKQSDGGSGKFLTIKKDGSRKCYKSGKQYKAAQVWAHESDEINEEENMVTEEKLREMIRDQLKRSWRSVSRRKLKEVKEDQDFELDELEGLNLPPVLKKLLDPNITPAKYADIDQLVDESGNVNHQAFAIAAFVLSYADMDEGTASAIFTKAKALLPKILKAREAGTASSATDQGSVQEHGTNHILSGPSDQESTK